MINKTNLLQHFQTDYNFINKIKGWCEQAHRGQFVYTDFIDTRQLMLLKSILKKEQITEYTIHCPMENNFRQTVTINTTENNTLLLAATQPGHKVLKHNEILGYILNELQLEQRVIGDLYVTETMIYLSVLSKIAPIFNLAPLMIQNNIITFTPCFEKITIKYQFDLITKTIKSLRLDALISALCGLSRSKAQQFLADDNVYINFSQINNKTFQIACDIIISIRRYGRYQIREISPLKNENYRVVIAKFK